MITACPLCACATPPPFLTRAEVPVHQNRTAATAAEARAMPCGALEMVACDNCGFVFNRAFDASAVLYGPGYDNSQTHSAAFATHMDGLARHLVMERGLRHSRIVEVGCGQGAFLRRLVDWPGAGNSGIGFDPAYDGPAGGDDDKPLHFVRGLYGADCADIPADAVVCRHVIEHVSDPLALLRAIRTALAGTRKARLFIETPDVGWIFRHGVLWDLFYEHCSLFSATTLASACARAGFHAMAVRRVFGEQYLWLEAELAEPHATELPGDIYRQARDYAAGSAERIRRWQQRIASLARPGPVAVWGAGAKGATFASLADPRGTAINCFVDINPAKQGRFVAGTGHPIVGPAALAGRGVRWVVPMNPAYKAEIAARLPQGAELAEWAD